MRLAVIGCAFSGAHRGCACGAIDPNRAAPARLHRRGLAEAVADGKIKNADEYQEMREFASQAQVFIKDLPANAARPQLLADATALAQRIDAKAAVSEVATRPAPCAGR